MSDQEAQAAHLAHADALLQQAELAGRSLVLAQDLHQWASEQVGLDGPVLDVVHELVITLHTFTASVTQSWVCTGLELHCPACGGGHDGGPDA